MTRNRLTHGKIAVVLRTTLTVAFAAMLLAPALGRARVAPDIVFAHIPNGGLQPEIAVDRANVIHLVYLAGEPAAADVYYVRSSDGGRSFSSPVRVNSQDGSAIATGTIRGAQIAIGAGGRVHVAWNGSSRALPKPPVNPKTKLAGSPMLYARASGAGTVFEPQRNLIVRSTNLDGGSMTADDRGGVYVAWHGQGADGEGAEDARRVWLARSRNDGDSFAKEEPISDPATGVCGCCALRIAATPDGLQLLYRSATATTHRDTYALVSRDRGATFTGTRVQGWETNTCQMTSASIWPGTPLLRAWETDGQVYFAVGNSTTPLAPGPARSANDAGRRKHPRIAGSSDGVGLIVWTEGTAWARGGSLAWQAFDATGKLLEASGTRAGIPVWSFAAAAPRPDGGFVIVY